MGNGEELMKRLSVLIVLMLAGCSRPAAEKAQSAAPLRETPVTAGDVVDGLTGRTAVRTGQRAQQQIKAINAKKNQQLEDVLEEK
jgi:hypothetical protein